MAQKIAIHLALKMLIWHEHLTHINRMSQNTKRVEDRRERERERGREDWIKLKM